MKSLLYSFLSFVLGANLAMADTSSQGATTGDNQGAANAANKQLPCPTCATGIGSFQDLLDKIIGYFITISIPILTIMVLWGGFQMLTARDDENQFKKGRKTITYAAIGFAVVICAKGAQYIIEEFLGVTGK